MLGPVPSNSHAVTLLLDKIRLPESIDGLRKTYRESKPFSHLVIDGMFSDRLLDSLLPEIESLAADQWLNIEQDTRERTRRMRSAGDLGDAGERFLGIAHSAAFLNFVSEITGVWQLLPDPYLQGAGYAVMRRGDYFHVHSDRSTAYDTGLTRRLAMIVYLNKSWKPEYHGQLELWNPQATRCEVRVEPIFNKTVIFEVAYPNFHGVPVPIDCPVDRSRQSIIVYYHTVGLGGNSNVKPHTSIFAPRKHGTNRLTFRSLARDVTPPVLTRAFRKLLRTK